MPVSVSPPEWKISTAPVDYPAAVAAMEQRVADIASGRAPEMVWLLEHPPLYTAGTSAREADLLDARRFPVYKTGRGGQFTYHGPGQRIAYVMLDLKRRAAPGQPDLRAYVQQLEHWIIATLARFGIEGFTREGRVGVWVSSPSPLEGEGRGGGNSQHGKSLQQPPLPNPPPQGGRESYTEAKIAALGIRIRKWVSYHGIAINVHPDLSHYGGIVPCGIAGYGVTSLAAMGISATIAQVDVALEETFQTIF